MGFLDLLGGIDWGGVGSSVGSGLLEVGKEALPAIAGAAAGYGLNALFPGKDPELKLVDQRSSQQIAGADMALNRAQNIQANPTSFGLPGDPNDPNTPAGKKKYDITQNTRSADAARSRFTTGGSAVRERNAVNTQVGNEYNSVWDSSMGTLAAQPQMQGHKTNAQTNPWGQILGSAVNPAVTQGLQSVLSSWGMSAMGKKPTGAGGGGYVTEAA